MGRGGWNGRLISSCVFLSSTVLTSSPVERCFRQNDPHRLIKTNRRHWFGHLQWSQRNIWGTFRSAESPFHTSYLAMMAAHGVFIIHSCWLMIYQIFIFLFSQWVFFHPLWSVLAFFLSHEVRPPFLPLQGLNSATSKAARSSSKTTASLFLCIAATTQWPHCTASPTAPHPPTPTPTPAQTRGNSLQMWNQKQESTRSYTPANTHTQI